MDKKEAKKRIDKLKKEIDRIRYHYHVLDESIVSDGVKDSLQHELELLESEFPELVTQDSPTQRVAGKPLDKFRKISHLEPMMSLTDAFSQEELEKWEERNRKIYPNAGYDYFCELKIDGFAVTLVYEEGFLKYGATRGDGKTGEDVTQNLRTIESIPLRLKEIPGIDTRKRIEVRGEVYLSKKEFEKINRDREKSGKPLYANPRNLAAGTVRQLDSKITAERNLDSYMYELVTDLGAKTHQEKHEIIKKLGFKTSQYVKFCSNIKDVYKYAESWEDKRDKLLFQVDGLVVIVNNLGAEERLGVVGKAPRWATAYKFSPEQVATQVEDIRVSLGRTGALTPYAVLKPTRIAGSTVRRATLHNEDEIKRKDIRIGDTVILQKAGDIIPEIVEPIIKLRTGSEKKFVMPKLCPICGGSIIKPEGEAVARCANKNCWAIEKEQIIHFVSKDAFDIVGLGEKIVEQLMEAKLVTKASDLFKLRVEDLKSLERFADKSAENTIESIQSSKNPTFARFIYALGIRHVGIQTANLLASIYRNLDNLRNATLEDLEEIEDIGPVAAKSIYSWFRNENNVELLAEMEHMGVKPKKTETSAELQGKSFVITGSLKKRTREEIEELIRQRGGKATSSVSQKTDYLILGEDPGSKYEKAQKLGVKIISESDFEKLI